MNEQSRAKIKAIILEFFKQERAESGCSYGQPDGYEDYINECDCDIELIQAQIHNYGISAQEADELLRQAHENS